MKRFLVFVFSGLFLLALLIPGCSNNSNTNAGTTYVVATDATYPPFESLNEATKEPEGFDIDLIKAIADKAGIKIEIKNVSWDPLLAGMAMGTYDAAISAMSITPERAKNFNFSDPYFNAGQLVVIQVSNTTIKSKNDLTGKKVGVQVSTTGQYEAEKIAGVTEILKFDDIGLAFQALMNGQVEAVVADNPVALNYVGKNPTKLKSVGDVFTDEFYGIAVAKNRPELLTKINQGLAAVKSAGTIETLTNKWIKK